MTDRTSLGDVRCAPHAKARAPASRVSRAHHRGASYVNCDGEIVALDPQHRLDDTIWMNSRLGRATMALPNGYCGLPLTRTCDKLALASGESSVGTAKGVADASVPDDV